MSIRYYKEIQPVQIWLFRNPEYSKEIIIFTDGSLALQGYSMYFKIKDLGKSCLCIVKANTKNNLYNKIFK